MGQLLPWLTIVAIILGPILALWSQRISERRRGLKVRQLLVFKELLATRATRVSPRHVEALNAIEMEFSGGTAADKNIVDAWRLYLDNLNDQQVSDAALEAWSNRNNDLLVDLLFEMSSSLGYSFDKVSLKKAVYFPKAHGQLETDQLLLRQFLIQLAAGTRGIGIFTGEKPLKVEQVLPQDTQTMGR